MFWSVHCIDKANTGNLRSQVFSAHVAHVSGSGLNVLIAGPLTAKDSAEPVGSLLIIESDDGAAVESFVKNAPFALSGLWETIHIDVFSPTKGDGIREALAK